MGLHPGSAIDGRKDTLPRPPNKGVIERREQVCLGQDEQETDSGAVGGVG